ncbi:MAG TPA: hypothetical protein P5328_01150 [Candidatus Paceibacterota bacterium]|nr:hypothetical protein [Candidatus Paceibacterota bacterium]HRZ34593.1 hypothetical protein [Candidatus Paceibacterota bacterium]
MKSLLKTVLASTFVLALFIFWVNIASAGLVPCTDPEKCNFYALGQMIRDVIAYVLKLGMVLSAIGFAWAGFLYLSAGGDSGKISKAHSVFSNILIGFLLAVGSFLIVDLIAAAFGLKGDIVSLYNKFIR